MGIAQPVTSRQSVAFSGPDGSTIAAQPVRVDTDPDTYRLTIEIPAADYAAVVAASLFHLTPAGRGPDADRFQPEGPVWIDLRPGKEVLDDLVALGRDASDVVDTLVDTAQADSGSALVATGSWFALSVTAEVEVPAEVEATLREGYRTVWSGDAVGGGSPLLATVARHLARKGIPVRDLAEAPGISWTTETAAGSWHSAALADDENGRLAVYGMLPTSVGRDRFGDVAMLITHLNSGMIIGNWELDVTTGELSVKTSIDVGEEPLTPGLAARLVGRNEQVAASGFAVVERLARGETTLEDALEAVATAD